MSDDDDLVVVMDAPEFVALVLVPWAPPSFVRPARRVVVLPAVNGLHGRHARLSPHARSPPLHMAGVAA